MKDDVRHTQPLRLHWWKAVPNFGDALSPMIVGHLAGRDVRHAGPRRADMFAVGSMLQVVRRNFDDPRDGAPLVVWGTGLLRPVNGTKFLDHVDVRLVRGPVTAALLGLKVRQFGDPGLLADEVVPFKGERGDRIGIVPHHLGADAPQIKALVASDPAYLLIDPRDNPEAVCRQIASCAHVFASSLHGLIVADAYGIPNTWFSPQDQGWLKYHDYAASVGRGDMRAALDLDEISDAPRHTGDLPYADGIATCRADLKSSFPAHFKAAGQTTE